MRREPGDRFNDADMMMGMVVTLLSRAARLTSSNVTSMKLDGARVNMASMGLRNMGRGLTSIK
jgi:hypothetical protein